MDACVNRIVQYFILHNYIDKDDELWTAYNLKRIITTTVASIPFFLLSYLVVGFVETLFYFGSFYLLRRYCNGYHSKTFFACIVTSLLLELIFLFGLRLLLTPIGCLIINAISATLIILFAPYDHPNMHYSAKEIKALKNSIWKTVGALEVVYILSYIFYWTSAMAGLTMGLAMTAFLLCLAYAAEWRKKNAQVQ